MSEEHGPDEVWTTRDGDQIKVGDLSETHAKNILRMIIKTERERKDDVENYLLGAEVLAVIRSITDELGGTPRVIIFDSEDNTEGETTMDDIDSMFRKHGAAKD